jgi:glutamate decarboxylase
MVHLAAVPSKAAVQTPDIDGTSLAKLKLSAIPEDQNTYSTTVYGSRYAVLDLPKHEMPEDEMPREVAYRMIKYACPASPDRDWPFRDELTLDGNPTLNLASFVTTYMEEEAEKLMIEGFSKNFIDYEEYPVSADIQNRCVSMIARLFNVPVHDEHVTAMGTSTIGSSEAIMLGILAMKKKWANRQKAAGKPYDKPNLIMNSAVQVCWEKGCRMCSCWIFRRLIA